MVVQVFERVAGQNGDTPERRHISPKRRRIDYKNGGKPNTVYVPIEAWYPIEARPPFREKNYTRMYIFVIRWKVFPTKTTYKRFF